MGIFSACYFAEDVEGVIPLIPIKRFFCAKGKLYMKKEAFYFPHFCNARHDRKIRRVRKELGLEGYGIFFMILEVLREQADYKYPMEDMDLLADEFDTSEQKIRTVVCNYDLFSVDDEENFFSSNLIMYLQPYFEGKEKRRISGIRGNLIKHKYFTKEQLSGKTDQDILLLASKIEGFSHCDRIPTAIKVKEMKGNKIKREEEKTNKKESFQEYKSSNPPFQPYIPPPKDPDSRDYTKEFEQIRNHWNQATGKDERKSLYQFSNSGKIMDRMEPYTDEEIKQAISNFSQSDECSTLNYSLQGFLETGVPNYLNRNQSEESKITKEDIAEIWKR